ncbi:hypothetical protein [Spirulina sp. 06S082]|uniref:hypothetical protein n=1 Tax=Spirulina sp. 06S082 TaxID=3110248 RepID=UPI002B20E948|nr:hypothetical protein [Spirulina sp. 06S082]MEA5471297.1 hypothetical protein [Spirulina sp. 06S082]
MILDEINSNALAIPCNICGQPIGNLWQHFRIPPFEPYIDKNIEELQQMDREAHQKAQKLRSYANTLVHRHCWSNWSHQLLVCSLAIKALEHEFRGALRLAKSNRVAAYSTKHENPDFTPGVLFLPRGSLISQHLFGIELGNPVVRERGQCVESFINVLTQDKISPGFTSPLSLHQKIYLQCDEEIDEILKINFFSAKNILYAVYFLYKPDIELLKQAILPSSKKSNRQIVNLQTP